MRVELANSACQVVARYLMTVFNVVPYSRSMFICSWKNIDLLMSSDFDGSLAALEKPCATHQLKEVSVRRYSISSEMSWSGWEKKKTDSYKE